MRILIVEDELKTAAFFSEGLKENGFFVNVAHDGKEGLFLAKEYAYDLIILDVMLPKLDGWALIAEIRKIHPDRRILFITARDGVHDRVKGFDLGADDYLMGNSVMFRRMISNILSNAIRYAYPKTTITICI